MKQPKSLLIQLGVFLLVSGVISQLLPALAAGNMQLVYILVVLAPLAGIVAGVYAGEKVDSRQRQGFNPGVIDFRAVAWAQKLLMAALVLQLLIIPSGTTSLYFAPLIAAPAYGVASALRFNPVSLHLWPLLVNLRVFVGWITGIWGLYESSPGMFLLVNILALLTGIIFLLALNKKATAGLKNAGFSVGFLGAKLSDLPPSPDTKASAVLNPAAQHDPEAAIDVFYYLDANNQPIGPLTLEVLGQLKNSGALSDETLVAAGGGDTWQPLGGMTRES